MREQLPEWDQLQQVGVFARAPDERLGELAVARGWISREQLESALQEHQATPQIPLGAILVRRRLIKSEQLAELLREQRSSSSDSGTAMFCASCRVRYRLKTAVVTSRVTCPRCGATLVFELAEESLAVGEQPAPAATLPAEVSQALENPANRFGKFVKVALLGEGGMGSVWKCFDLELRRWVAVKFVEGVSELVVNRVMREAQAAAKLRHPNIVQVHEVGRYEHLNAIVMQYIEGRSLGGEALPVRTALEIVRDVARAVDAAHRHGVIHRDLKPANILLDNDGRPYVADFGLAKEAEGAGTRSGVIAGTPAYMAPEQARGDAVDARADVYGLGATLYELLAGRAPFDHANIMETLAAVATQDPLTPRTLRHEIPADVETIVLKAMEKERARRYATAAELAEDIERYLNGDPIRARPSSVVYRLRRKLLKHRGVALRFALAMLLGVGFGAYVLVAKLARDRLKEGWISEAELFRRQGRWQEALSAYERAAALDPDDAWLREQKNAMASELAAAQERLKAALVYEQAARSLHMLRLRSYRPEWRLTKEEIGEYLKIAETCRAEMAKSGECGAGWWLVGRVRHLVGDLREATAAYDAGLRAEPGHAACQLYKARLLVDRALVNRFKAHMGGDRLREAGAQMKEALQMLRAAVASKQVSQIELDLARGYELVLLDQEEDAMAHCARMLERWRGQDFWEEFYLVRGLARPETLVAEAAEAIKARPRFHEAYFWRGVAHRKAGKLEAAETDFSAAVETHPRYAEAYAERGDVKYRRGDYRGAVEDCSRALEIDPLFADAYNNRGNARDALEDVKGAIADYSKAIELAPGLPDAYYNRGRARYLQGDVDGALQDWDKTIDLRPTFAAAIYNRGNARYDKGDLEGARRDYSEAIRLQPNDPEPYTNRGLVCEDLAAKDAGQARELLRQAEEDFGKALDLGGAAWEHRKQVLEGRARVRARLEKFEKEF